MGLEDEINVTDDIGRADAILASASEIKQNPWVRGIAKFHKLPLFVIKVCSNYFHEQLHGKNQLLTFFFLLISLMFDICL